jgi:hypothetical protein
MALIPSAVALFMLLPRQPPTSLPTGPVMRAPYLGHPSHVAHPTLRSFVIKMLSRRDGKITEVQTWVPKCERT